MVISNFARIGKGPLLRAVGLQKNHKEIIEETTPKLDEAASGCFSCPNYRNREFMDYLPSELREETIKYCQDCPSAVYLPQYKIRYVNETNMYGYQPRLKNFALKLLLFYHFLSPDKFGLLCDVSPKKLADQLGCNIKTIINSNHILQQFGYISIGNSGHKKGFINILLTEYRDYYKTAKEGGHGYFSMSSDLLLEILKIKDLNQLRISLRTIAEADRNCINIDNIDIKKSFDEIRRFLPQYCKPNVIKTSLSNKTNIYTVNYKEDEIIFQMPEKYNSNLIKAKMEHENKELLQKHVDLLNDVFEKRNEHIDFPERIPDAINEILTLSNVDVFTNYQPLLLMESDYDSLATLSVQYSLPLVKEALAIVYNTYIQKNRPVENTGGLIRTIIKDSLLQKFA